MALPWTMISAGENPVPNNHLEMWWVRGRTEMTWGKEKMESSLVDKEKETETMRQYSLSSEVLTLARDPQWVWSPQFKSVG